MIQYVVAVVDREISRFVIRLCYGDNNNFY